MKTYKIGVWVDSSYSPEAGGGYSFLSQMLHGIAHRDFSSNIEIFFIGFNLTLEFNKPTINIPFKENYLEIKRTNFYHKLFKSHVPRRDIEKNYINAEKLLKEKEIDIIFYPTQNKYIRNYPFIIVQWDLGHRSTYPFPEMALDGNWEYREETLSKNLHKALLIGCESESGKTEIIKNYNIFPKKIKTLSLFPGKVVSPSTQSVRPTAMNENNRFFIYPAQFWAHKNHYNLLLAFESLLKSIDNKNIKLVLTGSDHGGQLHIRKLAESLNIARNIVFTGFIADEELKWLYQNTIGLIFPSFLGPTNMPLLEAHYLDCNLACSNFDGHREMMGNNALYFEPENPQSISESMRELISLADRQQKLRSEDLTNKYSIANSLNQVEEIFEASMNIRNTWDN